MIYILYRSSSFLFADIKRTIDPTKVVCLQVTKRKIRSSFVRMLRGVHLRSPLPFKRVWLDLSELQSIRFGSGDTIIQFGGWDSPQLDLIRTKGRAAAKIFWAWNTLTSEDVSRLDAVRRISGNKVWTFDEGDAKKYDIRYHDQFYWRRSDNQELSDTPIDLFFVGQDKGRAEKLYRISEGLPEIECRFILVDSPIRCGGVSERISYNATAYDYEETLAWIRKSRCLLELTLPEQSGLTLRALEATFHGKLLITDNDRVAQHSFYDPDRILIVSKDLTDGDLRAIADFIAKTRHLSAGKPDLGRYTFEQWLADLTAHSRSAS